MSIKRSEFVENCLQVKLPNDYANFLDTTGDFLENGVEIFGYSEDYIDINKIPCVIGATKLYSSMHNLYPGDIVISHSGYESDIVILNTVDGCVYEVSHFKKRKLLSTSFKKWFNQFSDK